MSSSPPQGKAFASHSNAGSAWSFRTSRSGLTWRFVRIFEFGLRAQRLPEKHRRRRVQEMVDLVGLGDYLSAKPGELSGGQQQRVALARTLAVAPGIVLMDDRRNDPNGDWRGG
jgi:ABC-type Fe3+/spermidine/putrescine transport system ATPase subunit